MAATSSSRAAARAKENEDKKPGSKEIHVDGENGHPKGQPDRGKKRSHSPEGGGVAGSSDRKRHKNAYEISALLDVCYVNRS